MTRTPRSRPIPQFKSLEEEAEFWDKHSPLDFPDEWVEVKRVKVARPLGHILAVRLDARTIDRLAEVGRAKGLGPSTLARMWLLERLEQGK
jgi:hypothetical protein